MQLPLGTLLRKANPQMIHTDTFIDLTTWPQQYGD